MWFFWSPENLNFVIVWIIVTLALKFEVGLGLVSAVSGGIENKLRYIVVYNLSTEGLKLLIV